MWAKIRDFVFFCVELAVAIPYLIITKLFDRSASDAIEQNLEKMNDNESTEVKCSEHSKGGIKYELVLSAPVVDSPKHVAASTPPRTSLSVQDIEKKLIAAEERKKCMEQQKLNFVTEKLSQLETAKEKREEFNQNFIQTAKEKVMQRQGSMKENRENYIKTIQEKAREIVQKVDEKRKSDDTPDREKKLEDINKKLMTASEIREMNLNNLKERLKEHDKHISEVKKQMETIEEVQSEQLREKSVKKLEVANAKRETILKEIQEKIKEHERHIEEVRQKACSLNNNENCENLSG